MSRLRPADILQLALRDHIASRTFADVVNASGVTTDIARRAAQGAKGRPTSANAHLRLCAVMGLEPVTGAAIAPSPPADLMLWFLALGLRGHRFLRGHNMRQAADAMGISLSTVCRIEIADRPVSFDSTMAALEYMGRHPFDYLPPTCSTGNITGNTLIAHQDSDLRAA